MASTTDVLPASSKSGTAISIKKLGVFCGAQVTGVDLTKPLDAATVEAIRLAHAEHGVVVFPNQKISSQDLMRFGRYFGELSVHPFSTNDQNTKELIIFDNKEGNPPLQTDVWHSDEMFRECPPMGTILCCKIIPELGGDTSFASMTAVYEGLSDRMQKYLSGLEAVNDFIPFKISFARTKEGRESLRHFEELYPPVTHPVVRVHTVTKQRAIYVSPIFTLHIKGMAEDESRMLLDYLYRRTFIHEYHYRHRWQPDMVVFWDNRSVQHSALHDYYPNRRLIERVTVRGDRPIGDAPPADPSELRRYLMPPITAFEGIRRKRQNEL